MQLRITHTTTYRYGAPAFHGVQELRLSPQDTKGQRVLEWNIDAPGIENAPSWNDAWGNLTYLTTQTEERTDLAITVNGMVEIKNVDGVVGELDTGARPAVYRRSTPLTQPTGELQKFAAKFSSGYRDQVALYHDLMGGIRERMRFDTAQTDAQATAGDMLKAGCGVCQDFSHVFIAVARILGQPARYVTGYMLTEGQEGITATANHAWVEADIAGLGWVGFDPTNGICPDERYVRLACGLDATYAAPIRGIRRGAGVEEMTVQVDVHEAAQQQ